MCLLFHLIYGCDCPPWWLAKRACAVAITLPAGSSSAAQRARRHRADGREACVEPIPLGRLHVGKDQTHVLERGSTVTVRLL
jgi:hypothetical protein